MSMGGTEGVEAGGPRSRRGPEEAPGRLPAWEGVFWEMLQKRKAGRGVHEKRLGDGWEGGRDHEPGPAVEVSKR